MAATPRVPIVENYRFADDGEVPNNPQLTLIVYRGVLETGADAAASCVALFERNGWTGAWRNGVYLHHHYHSNAHEVLGIAAGWVRVRLGGERGRTVELPRGQNPDMGRPGATDRVSAGRRIDAAPLPTGDPVHGASGPLLERWRAAERG